jgi:hypothetical protein
VIIPYKLSIGFSWRSTVARTRAWRRALESHATRLLNRVECVTGAQMLTRFGKQRRAAAVTTAIDGRGSLPR